jgi:hypothetical protein
MKSSRVEKSSLPNSPNLSFLQSSHIFLVEKERLQAERRQINKRQMMLEHDAKLNG